LVYVFALSKRRGKTVTIALGSMVLCFVLMLVVIRIIPALDTHIFGVVMGYVSLLVGALAAFFCDARAPQN
jgi:hypothetical protein